jgi:hypothetical protein
MNAAGMTLFAILFPEQCKPVPFILPLWGIAALVWGIVSRHRRYQELIRGDFTHTYANGSSRLERLSFWPGFLQAESRIVRWIEPGFFWLVGLISTFFLSRAFGIYLMLSSVFMAAFQELVYQTSLSQIYDLIDSDIVANAQSRLLAFLTSPASSAAVIPKTIEGVPTGAARDLMAALERRKARKINAPDNQTPGRA